MKRSTLFLSIVTVAALLLMAAQSPRGESAPGGGMITDAKGKVQALLPAGKAWSAAAMLMELPPGTALQGGEGSSVTVTFFFDGHRESLKGPFHAVVKAQALEVRQGSAQVKATGKKGAATFGKVSAARYGAGMLRDGLAPEETSPLDTETIASAEGLVITFPFNARRAWFLIEGMAAPVKLEKGEADIGALGVTLEAGKTYRWYLLRSAAPPARTDISYSFTLLKEEDRLALAELRKEAEKELAADPGDRAGAVTLVAIYLEKDMFTGALRLARALSEAQPQDESLQELVRLVEDTVASRIPTEGP